MAYKSKSPLGVVEGGTGATTLTGILTGNGTSAVTASAVTQYNVQIGGASNTLASVAPSATSGVPLISQGSSANPTFGTAVVAGGGTGVTSATAYAVLCGGTSSTGAFQSVAGLGASGEVLTSNGAAALPTWQAAGGSGISQIDGDTSSVSGSTVTLTGGTSGAVFTGDGATTMTASFDFLALPSTTSSNGQITINGNRFISAPGSTNNVGIGLDALDAHTSGNHKIAIGANAMGSITSGAADSIAIGKLAFGLTTTGGSNAIAIGSEAIGNTTNANAAGVAIGTHSLRETQTGTCIGVGYFSLKASTSGDNKIGIGPFVMQSATTGAVDSIAIGANALDGATTGGDQSIAIGTDALGAGYTGSGCVAVGHNALDAATGATDNVGIGKNALGALTSGDSNTALGDGAGSTYTTESNNITIGNSGTASDSGYIRIGNGTDHSKTFIEAIRGVTTDNVDAINVLIDSAGQLGTVSSSRRYKINIEDMNESSTSVLNLRPVTFDYRNRPSTKRCVGLIAEEVEEVYPDLVVYNQEGSPETVKYQDLPVLLLNELQKAVKRIEVLEKKLADKE